MSILIGFAAGACVTACVYPRQLFPLKKGEEIANVVSSDVANRLTNDPIQRERVRIVTKVAITALALTALVCGGSLAASTLTGAPLLQGFVEWLFIDQIAHFFVRSGGEGRLSFYTAVLKEGEAPSHFGDGRGDRTAMLFIGALAMILFNNNPLFFSMFAARGIIAASNVIIEKRADEERRVLRRA